jgi:hypothetical protein
VNESVEAAQTIAIDGERIYDTGTNKNKKNLAFTLFGYTKE